MGWFETVSDAVYTALCSAFDCNPDKKESMSRFVPAYLFQATTPQADRNVNVCYYDIRPADDPGFNYQTVLYAPKDAQNVAASVRRNIPITVLFTFYGPNADNDSEKFWSLCQADIDYRSPRSVLRKYHIVMNGRPGFPVGLDQIEGTYIRRRCDVRVNLVLRDVNNIGYVPVENPPDMSIQDSDRIIHGIHYQT